MFISGAEGQLEAILEFDSSNPDFAIICHPHPQYGGNMFDHVVGLLGQSFTAKCINTLKFNFRGVGSSEAAYDNGNGETKDVLAAISWCTESYPEARYYICGYSFGAIMVLNALDERLDESRLRGAVLIAPPVQMLPRCWKFAIHCW